MSSDAVAQLLAEKRVLYEHLTDLNDQIALRLLEVKGEDREVQIQEIITEFFVLLDDVPNHYSHVSDAREIVLTCKHHFISALQTKESVFRMTLEKARVLLQTEAMRFKTTYQALGLEKDEWIVEKMSALDRLVPIAKTLEELRDLITLKKEVQEMLN